MSGKHYGIPKFLLLLFFALILSNFLSINPIVIAGSKAIVNVDLLNVRSGPGLNYKVIHQVKKGDRFAILEAKSSWSKLQFDNFEGWVASWLIDTEKNSNTNSEKQLTIEASVDTLNVRTGPSTSFSILEQIHRESKYLVLEQTGDWIKIQLSKERVGWVAKWLVKFNQSSSVGSAPDQNLVIVEANILNVRSGPSTTHDIVARLNKGDKVSVAQIKDGWYQIKIDNQYGWIASQYATEKNITKPQISNKQDQSSTQNNQEPMTSSDKRIDKLMVNVDILNLRNGPGTNYKLITQLEKGDILVKKKINGDWSLIEKENNPSISGWVANWLVINYNGNLANQPTVTILNPGTNLREGPSTNTKVIAHGNIGDQFPIIGISEDWYQVQLKDGRTAYVAGWIVSVNGIENEIKRGIENSLRNKIIVVDAGHGGRDDGATGSFLHTVEKNLNLLVAKRLQRKLEAAGAKVLMTRTNDIKLGLQERVDIGIIQHADAFISIHHNTNESNYVSGTITYFYDQTGKELALSIQNYLVKHNGLKDLRARYGNYYVLRENPQLSVLVELAFLTNYHDELKANQDKFQENSAEGIFQGILKYFENN